MNKDDIDIISTHDDDYNTKNRGDGLGGRNQGKGLSGQGLGRDRSASLNARLMEKEVLRLQSVEEQAETVRKVSKGEDARVGVKG